MPDIPAMLVANFERQAEKMVKLLEQYTAEIKRDARLGTPAGNSFDTHLNRATSMIRDFQNLTSNLRLDRLVETAVEADSWDTGKVDE